MNYITYDVHQPMTVKGDWRVVETLWRLGTAPTVLHERLVARTRSEEDAGIVAAALGDDLTTWRRYRDLGMM